MKARRMPLWLGWTLALLVAAGFARLGLWQLARMHEKQAVLASVQAVLAQRVAQPLALAADPARARGFDWAAGEGRFAASPAVLLDNQNHQGRAGVRAYRVFEPAQPGALPVLVELGWLPLPGDRRLPQVPAPDVERVAGLLLPPPSPGLAAPVVQVQSDGSLLVVTLDPQALAPALGVAALAPRVLRLDPDLPVGYARDLDLLPNTLPPERHLGYAVQWFALALAMLVIAALLTWRLRGGR